MVAFTPTSLEKPPQYAVFERLKTAILDAGQDWSKTGVVLTDSHLADTAREAPFLVVVTPEFRVLLQAPAISAPPSSTPTLTLNSQVIAAFLKKLQSRASKQTALKTQLTQALAIQPQSPKDSSRYEALIQQLFGVLGEVLAQPQHSPSTLTCQPLVDAALYQQVKQEQLINQVTIQIRQSLELPIILQTAVDKVQECLAVDRLLIYQFNAPAKTSVKSQANKLGPRGRVAYESCAPASMPSFTAEQWATTPQLYQHYRQGHQVIAAQVQCAADLLDGPIALLYQHQVTAQMVMPLLVQNQLWGLLIAHRCQPHPWEQREIEFLDHITDHLGIAIHQAELYQQLQAQKHTLEDQVNQRTQELQAALVEIQTANQVKNEFLSTISHELRTPLTCVIGMSATLMRWSLGPLNDKQRDYLQTIHDSGEHLLDLINDILDFSQAESGKATLELSEFSLSALVQNVAQMLREQAEQDEITLRVMLKILPERDRFVADSRRVKQILFSLLSNAIKFTQAGGDVTLRVWLEANAAVFQVEDNGIGIPAHQQPLLFQKFQQLDTSYRRAYDGAGLGLALAKQMVDMHRGWIEVNSTEGQGSTFTVEIPNQISVQDNETLRSPSPTDLNARIVLIEDQEESATLICEMLTAAGYHVVWIVEDSTALQQIQFLQPTAAIISIDRSEGNGLRLIQQFRQIISPPSLKIIALAPKIKRRDSQTYLAAGADTVLTKPLNPEYLVHKMDMLLTHSPKAVVNRH
jgi:two-component system sensor histidine kinase/response regulator